MENRMTTHAFFPHLQMSDVGHHFLKKLSFKDDDDDDDNDDGKVHIVLPDAKERQAKNNDCAFSRVHHHHCDSRNLSSMGGQVPLA